MATFQERLKQVIGSQGYDPVMRRSIQTVLMFEAQRCIKDQLPSMRPFQRKIAHYNQLVALLNTLDWIPPHQRKEILWRTAAAKEPIDDEVAWKRSRNIGRDLAKIAERAKPFVEKGMSHPEVCEAVIQQHYESAQKEAQAKAESSGGNNAEAKKDAGVEKKRPFLWEHSHNHNFTAFRLYYKGDRLDPEFPEPRSPVPIDVPQQKPQDKSKVLMNPDLVGDSNLDPKTKKNDVGSVSPIDSSTERQRMLAEVREHLALLREFEGIVSEEELAQRKRDLFQALPPAPPPFGGKKQKTDD